LAFFEINRRYRELLEGEGLTTPEAILALPSVIIGGHPDRNVARVKIGSRGQAIAAILKREHRIPWKERLVNAWVGFGFISKSQREAITIRELQQAEINCPDWLAAGEDHSGRAFLLLRDLEDCTNLRAYLRNSSEASRRERRQFAEKVGRSLARLHNRGFSHGDLYSKHVYVNPRRGTIHLIDWQRARWPRFVSWRLRCRDLAALGATLEETLTGPCQRRACLAAYLRECKTLQPSRRTSFAGFAKRVIHCGTRLLRNRRIREMRQLEPAGLLQNVIWRDGEALCVTEEFDALLDDRMSDWLRYERLPVQGRNLEIGAEAPADLPAARLIFRRETRLWTGIATWIRGKKLISSSVRQAGLILRLQRLGMETSRLLAFGQRQKKPWCVESFILIQSTSRGRHSHLSSSEPDILETMAMPGFHQPAPVYDQRLPVGSNH
jgi:tRNA A-37 threonylcarbamoyl transferase component Bud32